MAANALTLLVRVWIQARENDNSMTGAWPQWSKVLHALKQARLLL